VRWSIGPFGVKDLFTLINLMGGVFGIYFVMDQRPALAGAAVLAGYLFGDTLDGVVARLTHTSNRFGSELDTATDHFVQAIVPAMIVYAVYTQGGHRALGFVLLAVVIACATVRQALFTVAKMGDPLMYCGLPRTVSGYASMAFVLSRFFFRQDSVSFALGGVLIPALSIMGLLPIPYMTHRGARRMQTYVKALVVAFLVTPVVVFFLARDFTFDVLFIWTFGYALLAWVPLRRDERRAFFVRYRQWAAEVSRA
jgi:CDP-diacylglycerol--serine O-phosphatidyltransferase